MRLGCREALQWIYRNGVVNVIVESDSEVLESLIKKPSALSSSAGLIINDCKSLIQSIMGCYIVHIRRSANDAAHCLAKSAASGSVLGELREVHPSFWQRIWINENGYFQK